MTEQLVVERPQVEALAELPLQVGAQHLDLPLADLVGERLTGPHDVAVDLVDGLAFGQPDVVEEELDGLRARPAQVVDAGIDDEPARAPRLVAKHAEAGAFIRVEAQLICQTLRIQRPALDEGAGQPAGA